MPYYVFCIDVCTTFYEMFSTFVVSCPDRYMKGCAAKLRTSSVTERDSMSDHTSYFIKADLLPNNCFYLVSAIQFCPMIK